MPYNGEEISKATKAYIEKKDLDVINAYGWVKTKLGRK